MKNLFLIALGVIVSLSTVHGQAPTVTIVKTEPRAVKGIIEVERDRDVTMNCYVENLQPGTLVRWQKTYVNSKGKRQTAKVSADTSVEDNTKQSIEKPTFFTWRLRLKSVGQHDTGNYSCFVMTTRQNRQEANMTVKVLVPPTLDPEKTSSDTVAREGDVVELSCNGTGYPPPTIEWTRLGGALLPIGKEKHLRPLLSIMSVKPEDRGKYRCRLYNTIGRVQQDIILDVKFRPIVTPQFEVVSQKSGYIIELQCLVEANPLPSKEDLRWFKGPRSISFSSERLELRAVRGAFNRLLFELIFRPVQEEDFGDYSCQIRNSEGSSSAAIRLERSDIPMPSKKLGRIISGATATAQSLATMLLLCLLTLILH